MLSDVVWPAGQSPSDEPGVVRSPPSAEPTNSDWTRAVEAVAQIVAAGSEPFICFDQSKNGAPGAPCDPSLDTTAVPQDMVAFAEVARRILMHFTQGWDNDTGDTYRIEYAEIWNEFWKPASGVAQPSKPPRCTRPRMRL